MTLCVVCACCVQLDERETLGLWAATMQLLPSLTVLHSLYCNPGEPQRFLLSAVWLWILMNPLSGSYNCFNKGVRQEQRLWRRRAQHGHTGYKRDQTCDLLTIGQSVTAGPPCHFKNVLQTLEEPGIEPQWGYFQVCDLNNCIYRTLETERLNWKNTKTRQDARKKKKDLCYSRVNWKRRQK